MPEVAAVRERHSILVAGGTSCGKTTTLRAILGLVPRQGSVRLGGDSIEREPTHRIVRRGIGYVPEDRDVFAGLTVRENLELAVRNGAARYELVHGLFPELQERAAQRAGTLSGGEVSGDEVICPRHGARFDIRTGAVTAPPAYEPVHRFPLRVQDGRVQVRDDRWD